MRGDAFISKVNHTEKIAKSWRSHWPRVIPFFAHPPEIRKVIYTTNAIESLNMSLRKVTRARGSFPNDEAVSKLLYLALRNIAKKWTMPLRTLSAVIMCSRRQFKTTLFRLSRWSSKSPLNTVTTRRVLTRLI